jgi:hypothetical protein
MVRCRAGTVCDCDRSIAYGTGSVGRLMRKGCATFGVNKWSDADQSPWLCVASYVQSHPTSSCGGLPDVLTAGYRHSPS